MHPRCLACDEPYCRYVPAVARDGARCKQESNNLWCAVLGTCEDCTADMKPVWRCACQGTHDARALIGIWCFTSGGDVKLSKCKECHTITTALALSMHYIRCQMTEAPISRCLCLAQQSAGIWRTAGGWGWLRATPQNRQLGGSPTSGVCLKLRSHSTQRQHDTPVHFSKVTEQRGTRRSTPCTGHQHSLRLGRAAVQTNSTICL